MICIMVRPQNDRYDLFVVSIISKTSAPIHKPTNKPVNQARAAPSRTHHYIEKATE